MRCIDKILLYSSFGLYPENIMSLVPFILSGCIVQLGNTDFCSALSHGSIYSGNRCLDSVYRVLAFSEQPCFRTSNQAKIGYLVPYSLFLWFENKTWLHVPGHSIIQLRFSVCLQACLLKDSREFDKFSFQASK